MPARRRIVDRVARRPASTCSSCGRVCAGRTATRSWPPTTWRACAGSSIRRRPRRTRRSSSRSRTRWPSRAASKPPATLGVTAPDARTVSIRLGDPAPYLLGLLAQPLGRPGARGLARGERQGVRAAGQAGLERRLRARGLGHRLARRPAAQRQLLEQRRDQARARAFRARCGRGHGAAPVPRRSTRRHATSCRRSSSGGSRSNLASELHVSPQLSIYYYGFNLTRPPFKNNPGLRRALSLVIDRDKLTICDHRRGRGAGLWLGAAAASGTTRRSTSTTPPSRYAERVAEARKLYAAAGYSRGQAAARRAALQHRRRAQPARRRGRVDVEGRARRRDDALCRGVQGPAADDPGAARKRRCSGRAGSATTTTPFRFAQLLQSDFGINLTGYANPQYDALLAEAVAPGRSCSVAANCSKQPSA